MLINLFQTIRSAGVPCTLRELLDLLGALENQLVYADLDDFYYLSRATLVKDEKHYDKFDKAFDIYFKGIEKLEDVFQALIPEDWLRKAFEKELERCFGDIALLTPGLVAIVLCNKALVLACLVQLSLLRTCT